MDPEVKKAPSKLFLLLPRKLRQKYLEKAPNRQRAVPNSDMEPKRLCFDEEAKEAKEEIEKRTEFLPEY